MGNSLHTFSNVTSTYLQTYRSILNNMIQSITKVEPSDSISYNFILQILPHCQAAIQMSENALQYKIYPDLKSALETSRILQEKEVLQIQYLLQCIE